MLSIIIYVICLKILCSQNLSIKIMNKDSNFNNKIKYYKKIKKYYK